MKKMYLFFLVMLSGLVFSQTYDLKLNLEKGKSYELMQQLTMDMLQKTQGQEIPIKIEAIVGLTAKVLDKTQNNYRMETSYTYIATKADAMGNKMNLDSETQSQGDVTGITDVLKSLVGEKIYITISDQGIIQKIEGINEVLEKIKKNYADNPLIKDGKILSMYSEESITQMFSLIYNFPSRPVKIGDQWNSEFVSNNMYKVSNNTTYTLKSVDRDYYTVSFLATLKTLPAQIIENAGMKMIPDLSGTNTGEIKLNKKSLWIANQNSNGNMQGTVTIIDMGDLKIDMEIKTTTSFTQQSKLLPPPPPMETK